MEEEGGRRGRETLKYLFFGGQATGDQCRQEFAKKLFVQDLVLA